jgi:hypothetical protein
MNEKKLAQATVENVNSPPTGLFQAARIELAQDGPIEGGYPVVLGRGKPLFKDVNRRHDLRLMKATTYKTGALALRLRPDR